MIVASFHSCGAPPPCHTPITTAWNCSTVAYGCYHRNLHVRRVLSGPAGISSGPTAFRFDMLVIVSSTSKMEGRSSRGVHGGHTLSSSTILGSSARWRLSVDQRDEPLFPTIANGPHVTKQTVVCVLDVLRSGRFPPRSKSIPLRYMQKPDWSPSFMRISQVD